MAGMGGDDFPALDKRASNNRERDARKICEGIHGTQLASSPPVLRTLLDAKEYSMSQPRLGKCVIFNYKNFDLHTNKPERTGTDLDADNLQNTFRDLGFEIVRYTDLSCKETKDTLKNLGEQDYSDDDCFVCCFLTHGETEKLYATDGKFPVVAVMEPFHGDVCPSLLGKPKLFFIQACRGETLHSGTQADSPTRISLIPTHADVLVAYSTVPGFYSWCDTMQGSWFIQNLCSVLRERAHFTDVLSMLTVVCRRVSLDYESYMPKNLPMHCQKQVPFITSTLTRNCRTQSASPCPVLPAPPGAEHTPPEAEEYNMSHRRRGKCVIFNYQCFESHLNMAERTGTKVDAESLQSCFRSLGFDTVTHNDLSVRQTKETLDNLGQQDYSDDDCFVCCFLTHGGRDHLYGTDGKFSVNDVVQPFLDEACPSLIGKPKLFFIQACRGDRLDSGAEVVFNTADSPTWSYKIPDHPDILVACSTVPGFLAWRNEEKGSWFIQALCSVLQELAGPVDLLSMLTVVNRRVALEYKSYTPNNPHMCCKKQVPSFTSTLIRRVCFRQN